MQMGQIKCKRSPAHPCYGIHDPLFAEACKFGVSEIQVHGLCSRQFMQ